jgi:hypothetical protein
MAVEYGRILPSRALLAARISTLGLGQVILGRALSALRCAGDARDVDPRIAKTKRHRAQDQGPYV